MTSCPRRRRRLTRYGERLFDFGCLRTKSCTSTLFQGRICCASTPKQWSYSWKSCMKEFMGVIQEADPYLTELLLKDIGGPICKGKHKSTWRSVTNVRDLLLISISSGAFLTFCLTHGLLLSGTWTLWGPSSKQQETRDGFWLALITLLSRLKLSY